MKTAPVVFYVQPGKPFAQAVAEAFVAGCPLGGYTQRHELPFIAGHAAAFYGVVSETMSLWQIAERRALAGGLPFYYVDNGYFGAGHGPGGYLRVTRNALQHTGIGRVRDPERFARFNIPIKPWEDGGKHILICTQSEWWYQRHGWAGGLGQWVEETVAKIRAHSSRPIRLRLKPKAALIRTPNQATLKELEQATDERPLAADLFGCWCVVTHSSNAAVEAILAGIPALSTAECAAAKAVGGIPDFSKIEGPSIPDEAHGSRDPRPEWAQRLAENQWTLDEIRSGKCWGDLHAEELV